MMHSRIIRLFFYLIISNTLHFFSFADISSRIISADSLEILAQEMQHLNEQSLVIFDRDDTLLQGIDHIGPVERQQFIELWKQLYASTKTEQEIKDMTAIIQSVLPVLVDEHAPCLIQQLQRNKIKVIILTRGCHGKTKFGLVEDCCIAAFKAVGIDLSASFSNASGAILTNIGVSEYYPLFKSGILFSNTCNKGKALEAFLQHLQWKPNAIIFIDDKRHYLEEVQDSARQSGIPFLGIEYHGAAHLAAPDLIMQCFKMSYLLERDFDAR